ncbi:unnamed protein product [Tilletia controversa]|uniref:Replication factor A protein 3 n=3 Tax=Tilletia TaxID=13289 RepID=A0A8X7N246_9BASI|nr:hypothetical protein CF336_g3944 [Tilletia laevis]KAE8205892.1 hypothetical protein CF328_g235 [Tilletia controversa]KAE8261689.1 hypothetical protein A4X03_0g3047 [Tilletia caries]KAE8203838.1 hypothetical protein CF335_g2877 [Tilletia laevis]KAE8256006.1 hypothetical protein A4X06_0g139 [Tilletia controversa]
MEATPMINSSMLPSFRGKTVRVVGKVEKVVDTLLLLQTSDLGVIEVHLSLDTVVSANTYIEVIGKVSDSGDQLREFTTVQFGESLDLNLVEQAVQVSAKYPEIFSAGGEGES